jgi:hypothetical protein
VTLVVLVFLAAMWAAVLVPPFVRNRSEIGRRRDPVGTFRSQLNTLGRTSPTVIAPATSLGGARAPHGSTFDIPSNPLRPAAVPTSPAAAERRRRDVVRVLVGAIAVTFLAWFVTGSALIGAVHVLADVTFLVYAALVLRHRRNTMERAEKVRYLHSVPSGVVTARPLLVRSSGG